MAQKLTIEFKAKGSGALKKTLNDLHEANLRLVRAQGKYQKSHRFVQAEQEKTRKGMLELQRGARQTEGTFSVLRSKLLLTSFAMGLAIRPMLNLAKAAGDMDEIMSKANVVFGDNSEIVGRWASALGSDVGRAQSTLMEMVSTLQDTFVPLGFTRDSATQLSTSLTKLAIDVASFNNKMDADVIRDFQSAIVGNHETVRKYGIVITEASLKQEAYIMGISDGVSELSAAEKVQARLSLIQKGSADAMGDAKRTADSYANTIKRFSEFWKENSEAIGNALKPYIKAVAIFLSNERALKIAAVAASALAAGFLVLRTATFLATVQFKNLRVALARTGFGLAAVALGYLVEKFILSKNELEEMTDANSKAQEEIDNLTSEIELAIESQEKHTTSVGDSIHALSMQFIQLGHNSRAAEYSREVNRLLSEEEENLISMIEDKTKALAEEERVTKLIDRLVASTVKGKKEILDLDIKAIQARQNLVKEDLLRLLGLTGLAEAEELLGKLLSGNAEFYGKNEEKIRELIIAYKEGEIALGVLMERLQALATQTPEWVEKMSEAMSHITPVFDMISDMFGEQIDAIREHIDEVNEAAQAEIDIIRQTAKATLDEEKKTRRWQRMTAKQQAAFEKKLNDEVAKQEAEILAHKEAQQEAARKKANALLLKQFRMEQVMRISQAVMNTANAYTKHLDKSPGYAAFIAALGAIQVGLIAAQQPPKMAQGGLVGGRPHSQGGTMIEAERGEFVMSRAAVESIGVEAMNRINQGAGGASIVINFSGNVLSDDYIEDEAIPKIKEALRRGGDIGVG